MYINSTWDINGRNLLILQLLYKARNKIIFVSPYTTDPKKWPFPKIFFHDLEIDFFFYSDTEIYTFSLEDFSLLLYFSIQFYCKILNQTLF